MEWTNALTLQFVQYLKDLKGDMKQIAVAMNVTQLQVYILSLFLLLSSLLPLPFALPFALPLSPSHSPSHSSSLTFSQQARHKFEYLINHQKTQLVSVFGEEIYNVHTLEELRDLVNRREQEILFEGSCTVFKLLC